MIDCSKNPIPRVPALRKRRGLVPACLRALAIGLSVLLSHSVLAQDTPVGSLLVTVRAASSISFVFENASAPGTPGYCSITGSGTSTASLNLGTASIASDNQSCVTYTQGAYGKYYTLGNTIYVKVTQTGTSASYTLKAHLASAALTGVKWTADAKTLTTTGPVLTNSATYGADTPVALAVTVQRTVTTTNLAQTIDFTATSN